MSQGADPQEEYPLNRKAKEFRRLRTATYFARGCKVGKTPPGAVAFGKDLWLTPWSFRSHGPRTPVIYEGVR